MFGCVRNGTAWSHRLGVGGWYGLSCDVGDSTAWSRWLCVIGWDRLSRDDKAQGHHKDQNDVKTCCEMHYGA